MKNTEKTWVPVPIQFIAVFGLISLHQQAYLRVKSHITKMCFGVLCLLYILGLVWIKNMVLNMSHRHCFPNLKWPQVATRCLLGETYVYVYAASFKPGLPTASGSLVRRQRKMQAVLPEVIAQCPSALALSLGM